MVFYDSSALVKLLLVEPGSDLTRSCWSEIPGAHASRLAYVEVHAAIAAARRTGRVTERRHLDVKREFEVIWSQIDVLEASPSVVQRAAEVSERHSLRAYDAVQLASALIVDELNSARMLTWDVALAKAAVDAGLECLRPSKP